MVDEKDDQLDEFDDEPVVVMTDEEGNEFYYREEMIIPVGEKRYAILVPLDIAADCECDDSDCDCGSEETDVFIARIDVDKEGEEIYVDPTDQEFEQVRQAYEELIEDNEEA